MSNGISHALGQRFQSIVASFNEISVVDELSEAIGHIRRFVLENIPSQSSSINVSSVGSFESAVEAWFQAFESDVEAWSQKAAPGEDRATAKDRILSAYANGSVDLDLSGLNLHSLPDCIGSLTSIGYLNLSGNTLVEFPQALLDLERLDELDVRKNSFHEFPRVFFDLRPNCSVSFTSSSLNDYEHALIDEVHDMETRPKFYAYNEDGIPTPHHSPRLSRDAIQPRDREFVDIEVSRARFLERQEEVPCDDPPNNSVFEEEGGLEKKLEELFSQAAVDPRDFEFLNKLSVEDKNALNNWLSRMLEPGSHHAGTQTQEKFANKILAYLIQADADEAFRNVFKGVITDATSSCGDRVILSLLHVDIAYKVATADRNNPQALAHLLIHGPGALDILSQIAEEKVKSLENDLNVSADEIDPIEVYLAYPIQLREALNLEVEPTEMLFFAYSSVKQEDLDSAKQKIQNFYQKEEEHLKFLVNHPVWKEMLMGKYTKEVDEISKESMDMLDDPEQCDKSQEYYDQALMDLSKRILA